MLVKCQIRAFIQQTLEEDAVGLMDCGSQNCSRKWWFVTGRIQKKCCMYLVRKHFYKCNKHVGSFVSSLLQLSNSTEVLKHCRSEATHTRFHSHSFAEGSKWRVLLWYNSVDKGVKQQVKLLLNVSVHMHYFSFPLPRDQYVSLDGKRPRMRACPPISKAV